MSLEDPVTTTIRLLSKNLRVVKQDNSVTNIFVSQQWYDREFFKNYDGQITVGLASSEEKKLNLAGTLRQMKTSLLVNLWASDKPASSDTGRQMRLKMVEEVKRIVRQNMKIPNVSLYDFVGLGYPSGDPHKAFSAAAPTELMPSNNAWSELSALDYQKIWTADSTDFSKNASANLQYGLMLFRFKVQSGAATIQKIVLSFVGYGTSLGGNGSTIKVWNINSGAWESAQTGFSSSNETVSITLTANFANYIDANGYVCFLARTTNTSNAIVPAVLYCDYASCQVTVNGITYIDVANYQDKDKVDVKPFIFRTQFILKSWSIENNLVF